MLEKLKYFKLLLNGFEPIKLIALTAAQSIAVMMDQKTVERILS